MVKENQSFELVNIVLFCVWEDMRIWAHWNHSLDLHLNCLGPVAYFSLAWIPSGCVVGGGQQQLLTWWLHYPLSIDAAGNIFHSHLHLLIGTPVLLDCDLHVIQLKLQGDFILTNSSATTLFLNSHVPTYWRLGFQVCFFLGGGGGTI